MSKTVMIIIWVVVFCVAAAAGWYIGVKKVPKKPDKSQNTKNTKAIGKREKDEE